MLRFTHLSAPQLSKIEGGIQHFFAIPIFTLLSLSDGFPQEFGTDLLSTCLYIYGDDFKWKVHNAYLVKTCFW